MQRLDQLLRRKHLVATLVQLVGHAVLNQRLIPIDEGEVFGIRPHCHGLPAQAALELGPATAGTAAQGAAMKDIILAGGLGTQLRPQTAVTDMQLLPLYNQPLIFYPIQTPVRAGIWDVLVVIGGPPEGQFVSVLRHGRQ